MAIDISEGKKKRFEYKISLGRDWQGKLIRKSFYSTKSKADAKRKAEKYRAQFEVELLCGGDPARQKTLFKDWALKCLELYKKPYVKGNTYSGTYLQPVKLHLIPAFGNVALEDIRPYHVQEYINQMAKQYMPETVKKDYTVLSFIMQHAVENGLCHTNPANKSIQLPKIKRSDKKSYTQKQYDTAYAFAKEYPNGLPIMLMLETGISRSELLGLTWDDVDTEAGVLHINQGLVAYQNLDDKTWVMETNGLKNDFRRRSIPLMDKELIRRLAAKPQTISYKPIGAKECVTVTPKHLFHSPEGKPYQPNNWNNRVFIPFMKALHKAHPEVPMLSAHELRHTRATLWIAQGIDPMMVARLLGHSDTKMLMKVYDHTDVDTLRKVLEQVKTV